MRFSGHETFACRFAWLPKAYSLLVKDPRALSSDEPAMVELGLGKNMVHSLRFWVEAMGLGTPGGPNGISLTRFGHEVFSPSGHDPYIENRMTLWILHWNLSAKKEGPLFAWHYLLYRWPHPEMTRSEVIAAFLRESRRLGHSHSEVTLTQHLDVFLHTYLPSRSSVSIEDTLDGPLVELSFLEIVGERRAIDGRRESIYAFRRETKPDITPWLFAFCIDSYWRTYRPNEATLTLREISVGESSPGQVLKLTEDDIRARLEEFDNQGIPFEYRSSAVQGLLTRQSSTDFDFLAAAYRGGHVG